MCGVETQIGTFSAAIELDPDGLVQELGQVEDGLFLLLVRSLRGGARWCLGALHGVAMGTWIKISVPGEIVRAAKAKML